MSSDQTSRLGLPYLAAAQSQKHVTVNEALTLLDGLVQAAVESRSVAAEPAAPADGALYILPANAIGADWQGKAAGTLIRFDAGAWSVTPPAAGLMALVKDETRVVVYTGSTWADLGQVIGALANLTGLGVNGAPDDVNKLVVKSDASLFDHNGHGAQIKLNKAADTETASILFQTNYKTLAEWGYLNDSKFHLKVQTSFVFFDVLCYDPVTGGLGVGTTLPTARLTVNGAMRVKDFGIVRLRDPAVDGAGSIVYVIDDVGGPTLAYSDGQVWRRVYDRAPLVRAT